MLVPHDQMHCSTWKMFFHFWHFAPSWSTICKHHRWLMSILHCNHPWHSNQKCSSTTINTLIRQKCPRLVQAKGMFRQLRVRSMIFISLLSNIKRYAKLGSSLHFFNFFQKMSTFSIKLWYDPSYNHILSPQQIISWLLFVNMETC